MKSHLRSAGLILLAVALSCCIFSCSKTDDPQKQPPGKAVKRAKPPEPQAGARPTPHALMRPTPGPQPGQPAAVPMKAPDPESALKEKIKSLTTGKILFNPPPEMKVKKTVRVEARISHNVAANLERGLTGPGRPLTAGIKVAPFMKVSLHGDDFHIEAYSDEEQPLVETPDRPFAQWQWDVTPLSSGTLPLVLTAKAVIKIANNPDVYYDHPVLERKIRVRINPTYSISSFLQQYWQWLATTIVIPLGLWLYNQRRKRGKSRASR